MVCKLSPKVLVSTVMGSWFLATAFSQYLAAINQAGAIPPQDVTRILERLRALRMADENIYLRTSSINLFNGMVSLTFSCDGSHYLRYDEFLGKNAEFWFGTAA